MSVEHSVAFTGQTDWTLLNRIWTEFENIAITGNRKHYDLYGFVAFWRIGFACATLPYRISSVLWTSAGTLSINERGEYRHCQDSPQPLNTLSVLICFVYRQNAGLFHSRDANSEKCSLHYTERSNCNYKKIDKEM